MLDITTNPANFEPNNSGKDKTSQNNSKYTATDNIVDGIQEKDIITNPISLFIYHHNQITKGWIINT
jgi:hypothetical protein